MSEEPLKNREVIFEMYTLGNAVKVTAVDVMTMTEAIFQGPASTPDKLLKRKALKKLEFVMRKKGLIP
jgi:hypothetical protein